eukprot:3455339-Prorocentrum_lima.AAC.1
MATHADWRKTTRAPPKLTTHMGLWPEIGVRILRDGDPWLARVASWRTGSSMQCPRVLPALLQWSHIATIYIW